MSIIDQLINNSKITFKEIQKIIWDLHGEFLKLQEENKKLKEKLEKIQGDQNE